MRTSEATREAGAAIGEFGSVFMLHPQTLAGSIAAGYANPLAGYVAGRGGVLGDANGATVASIFAIFEPGMTAALWDEGVAVRGAAGAAEVYWNQLAEFARTYLGRAEGLARIAELGEKIITAAPGAGLPMFVGWRVMPLADDDPARAAQVMFVLRELRGDVHLNLLSASGVSPVEAHMLGHDENYTRMFGWSEPFADGADKKDRYAAVEEATNRRMTEILHAALTAEEIDELARLCTSALAVLKATLPA